MEAIFENEVGRVDLNGEVWRIKDIDGLGLVDKICSVVTYPDSDGQELIRAVTHGRIITISGDVKRNESISNELTRAMRIFNKPGTLKIIYGSKKRKIACRCTSFIAEAKDRNPVYQTFVMQLTADYPFFEDITSKKVSVFLKEDLIKDSFTLPCVFTKRISRRNILNSGDEVAAPIFYAVCKESGTENTDGGIIIKNHTIGKSFKLNYKLSKGEEVTVDFENRTVQSNIKTSENNNGNLIIYMSDDTFLSDFYFETGINDIECINCDADGEITMVSEYTNRYIEAVI